MTIHKDSYGDMIQIGELAEMCRVTTRTLRYYEDLKLIEPIPRSGGKRWYSRDTLARVQSIQEFKDLLGWSLDEIREVLGIDDQVKALRKAYHAAEEVDARLGIIEEARALALKQMGVIERKLARLDAMKTRVKERIDHYDVLHEELQTQLPKNS